MLESALPLPDSLTFLMGPVAPSLAELLRLIAHLPAERWSALVTAGNARVRLAASGNAGALVRVAPHPDPLPPWGERETNYATWASLFAATACLRLTETSLLTPGSSMVTPYSMSATSIVCLLWVIKMNCEPLLISRTISL